MHPSNIWTSMRCIHSTRTLPVSVRSTQRPVLLRKSTDWQIMVIFFFFFSASFHYATGEPSNAVIKRSLYTKSLSFNPYSTYTYINMCVLWKCKSCNSVGLNIPDISNAISSLFPRLSWLGLTQTSFSCIMALLVFGCCSRFSDCRMKITREKGMLGSIDLMSRWRQFRHDFLCAGPHITQLFFPAVMKASRRKKKKKNRSLSAIGTRVITHHTYCNFSGREIDRRNSMEKSIILPHLCAVISTMIFPSGLTDGDTYYPTTTTTPIRHCSVCLFFSRNKTTMAAKKLEMMCGHG